MVVRIHWLNPLPEQLRNPRPGTSRWQFGLPPGRIGIFESAIGQPAELSEIRRCQDALYHHTEQEIAPKIDGSRYAPSTAAHVIQTFQTLRDLFLMIYALRVCE